MARGQPGAQAACNHHVPNAYAIPCLSRAGLVNDLHAYYPVNQTWTNLSTPVSGTPPSPRIGHGFTAAKGRLYVHGGQDSNGDLRDRGADYENRWKQKR